MQINKLQNPILAIGILYLFGCHPGTPSLSETDPATCEGCHTNKDALIKYAPKEENGTSTGGGGG